MIYVPPPGRSRKCRPNRSRKSGKGGLKLMGGNMKKTMTALAAFTLVLGTAACDRAAEEPAEATAATGIAGTWKADPSSAQSENDTSSFLLADGQFTCNSCIPPYSTTADGQWQQVDRPGADEVMIEVVDDMTVKTAFRFEGRDLGNTTWTVSEDGNSMTQAFVNLDAEEQTEGNVTLTRTGPAPDGAHAMSGDWTLGEYGDISEAALLFTYALDGETLTSTFNGGSWSATLGGDPVAIEGSESGTMVQVEQTGDNTYRETYTRDGEVVGMADITIDGSSMSLVNTDPRDDSVFRYSATRQ